MDESTATLLTQVIPIAAFVLTVIVVACTAVGVVSKVKAQTDSVSKAIDQLTRSVNGLIVKVDEMRDEQTRHIAKTDANAQALARRVGELEEGFKKLNAS